MKNNFLNSLLAAVLAVLAANHADAADINLLNVSYDPTREFYKEYNPVFAKILESENRR